MVSKPLHVDDPFIYRVAEQIRAHPFDPYGFDIFWLQWPQPVFEELTPLYPDQRYILETHPEEISMRIVDLVAPIARVSAA